MRTGDRCAKVSPETTVLDTLLAMTKAQGGSAVVVNPDGTLAGIFTDGDFRRRIAASAQGNDGRVAFGLSTPVSEVMTAKPLFIRDDAYAVDLLKVFERRRIDDLPVCDVSGRVLGVVDIQDLPKMKVL
jgi:arabinose-5-phosphate isomerase